MSLYVLLCVRRCVYEYGTRLSHCENALLGWPAVPLPIKKEARMSGGMEEAAET